MWDSGDVIDRRYRLERSVGSGGMGIVYLATDLLTDEKVAVKVLHAATNTPTDVQARLKREIELLSQLHSPYIAELRGSGYLPDGAPYFVMEYLEGRDLKAELRRRGPLPCAEVAAYLVQTCRGVAVAHRLGIVHRDLKPHNLFLTGLTGIRTVKIVDFGVAKSLDATDPGLTATNTSVGTPLYMSPEQLLDARAVSTKADVWALGIILYELLAGFSPFTDDSPGAVIAAVTLDEPYPIQKLRPDISDGVARAIDMALRKLPTERLNSVEEFERLLLPFAIAEDSLIVNDVDEPSQVRPIPRPARTRVSSYLMERILVSMNTAAEQERITIRCLKPASAVSSIPIPERLSLVPSLQHLSPSLPEMILSGSVADTSKVSLSRPRRKFDRIYSSIALVTVFALVLMIFWLNPTHGPAPSSSAAKPLPHAPSALRQSETTNQNERPAAIEGSELVKQLTLSTMTSTTPNETTVTSPKSTQRDLPKARSVTAKKEVSSVPTSINTPQSSPPPMVPKHL
jgi:serine/threonine protein kinase